jgi:UDP-N-acetylglucosamine transferase subunit ALG13
MILVTIGTQLPFDRLVEMMDNIAPSLSVPVFAQIGKAQYQPKNIEWKNSINPKEFETLFSKATVIVSHAGMGTVLTAQKLGKPIIIFPRRAALGEHRNDHQMATTAQMKDRPGVYAAYDEADLQRLLHSDLRAASPEDNLSSGRTALVGYLSNFIQNRA